MSAPITRRVWPDHKSCEMNRRIKGNSQRIYRERTNLIWSLDPPEVALEIAQAASFLMSNSAFCNRCTKGRIIFASITAYLEGNKQVH